MMSLFRLVLHAGLPRAAPILLEGSAGASPSSAASPSLRSAGTPESSDGETQKHFTPHRVARLITSIIVDELARKNCHLSALTG